VSELEGDSRRAAPRVKCRWPIKCVTEDKKTFAARAVNISQGGIQISVPIRFDKGKSIYMEITGYVNGQRHTTKVVGNIVYVGISPHNDFQLGLKFTSQLPPVDIKFISSYIRTMMS